MPGAPPTFDVGEWREPVADGGQAASEERLNPVAAEAQRRSSGLSPKIPSCAECEVALALYVDDLPISGSLVDCVGALIVTLITWRMAGFDVFIAAT